MDKPQFRHDCTNCMFLGRYTYEDEPHVGATDFIEYDLYYCGGKRPTVLARYGHGGPDYLSGLGFGREGTIPALTEAYQRAKAKGLITDLLELTDY